MDLAESLTNILSLGRVSAAVLRLKGDYLGWDDAKMQDDRRMSWLEIWDAVWWASNRSFAFIGEPWETTFTP